MAGNLNPSSAIAINNNMSGVKTVRQLKEDLLKLQARPSGEGNTEKMLDILKRLDNVEMDIAILTETLIGATVSKLKSHNDGDLAITAKKGVKKWKGVAKASASNPAAAASAKKSNKPGQQPKRAASSGSSSEQINLETEWQGLPTLRVNICKKLHAIFVMSQSELSKDLHPSAVKQLCVSRAGEVEAAINKWSKGAKPTYTEKVRSLVFNLKKNAPLRERVIMGEIPSGQLPKLSPEQLATEEKSKERNATVANMTDSRRLDWEQNNEDKINDMCGIKGDLFNASLFTCSRCKSTKTTSTQK